MDFKKVKENLKKALTKYDVQEIRVGYCELQECIKVIIHVNDLDIDVRDIKESVESVLSFYVDKYLLLLEVWIKFNFYEPKGSFFCTKTNFYSVFLE